MNIFKCGEPNNVGEVALAPVLTLHNAVTVAALLLIAFSSLAAPVAARAQENATSPPAALQWPTLEPGPAANGELTISLLRNRVEEGANGELCKQLMKAAGTPIPANFTFDLCPASFRDQVAARQGKIRWEPGAKPTECGTNCVGRPFTATSTFRDRPNTIFAQLFGHLDFRVDVPNLPDRTVRYGYAAQFHCATQGAREGNLTIRLTFDPPTVIEGGFLEGILNFFSPVALSNAIEAAIRARLSTPGSQTVTLGRCSSIGVVKAADPADDLIIFNRPRPTPNRPGRILGGTSVLNTRSATVRFHRITRKPVFGFTPPAESGQFHVFLNGIQGNFAITPPLNLPASGGSADINLCKTVDMKDADRLQLIFVSSHGGAVWSQFGLNTSFGAGPMRTMTTSRTVMVAGRPSLPGVPRPRPGSARPEPRVLNEFELSYTIEFNTRPGEVIGPRAVTGGGAAPPRPGRPSILTTDTGSGNSAQPCRNI